MTGESAVVIGGERFEVHRDAGFVFGRIDGPGVLGLDANDMGISAVAGSIEWAWGVWWIVNLSRKRRLLIEREAGGAPQPLECSERLAVSVRPLAVLVPGAVYTHRIEVLVPETELARIPADRPTSGTLSAAGLSLSERDRDVLVAVFAGYLEEFPRRRTRPRTYQEAADRLGPPWTRVRVRKQVERLKERATRAGLYFDGPQANYDLGDYLLANGLLRPSDLDRLPVKR